MQQEYPPCARCIGGVSINVGALTACLRGASVNVGVHKRFIKRGRPNGVLERSFQEFSLDLRILPYQPEKGIFRV